MNTPHHSAATKLCPLCLGLFGLAVGVPRQDLQGQTLLSSPTTYTFKAWNGGSATLVMTSDISGQSGNNNSTDVSAVLTSVNNKPAVPTLDLSGQLGWQSGAFFNSTAGTYFANGAAAISLTFTALADKKQAGTTGTFTVVFDTSGDGIIGSSDSGLTLNTSFAVQNNTVTVTQTSIAAFTLSATNGPLTPTAAFTVTNVTPLGNYTANINGSTTGSGSAADGSTYSIAVAALIADVSGTWHPVQGSPTLTTAFTSTPILGAGSISLIDWYGTSASAVQTTTLNIPEPATWAWSIGLIAPGALVLLRQRLRSAHR